MAVQFHNVLIILPRQLGDILLGTSLARVLKYLHPETRISWLAHPMGKQILNGHPFIDEVFYSKGEWKTDIALFKQLRRKNFDVVIDAMAIPRTALISRYLNAPQRISFKTRASRNIFYTDLIARERLDEGYLGFTRLKLLEPLGIDENLIAGAHKNPFLPIGESEKQKARELAEPILKNRTFITLSPTHRRPVRQWPAEKYVELAIKFIQKNIAVAWLWGPGEDEFVKLLHADVQTWCRENQLSEEFSFFPPLLSLRETAALCGLSLCFVGNSNGLSHIAVAGGAKTVQLHGSTLARVWTHPNTAMHCGIEAGCIQACLGNNTCLNPQGRCLEKLSVQVVFQNTMDLIGW